MLFAVCCSFLVAIKRSLCVVRCWLLVVGYLLLLCVFCLVFVRWSLLVVRCSLFVDCCFEFGV